MNGPASERDLRFEVFGSVVDERGVGIPAAEIWVGTDTDPESGRSRSVRSDSRGEFLYPGLRLSSFGRRARLFAQVEGRARASRVLYPWLPSEPRITLGPIALVACADLRVVVVDSDERPIVGASVSVSPNCPVARPWSGNGRTDAEGGVAFPSCPLGQIRLLVRAKGYQGKQIPRFFRKGDAQRVALEVIDGPPRSAARANEAFRDEARVEAALEACVGHIVAEAGAELPRELLTWQLDDPPRRVRVSGDGSFELPIRPESPVTMSIVGRCSGVLGGSSEPRGPGRGLAVQPTRSDRGWELSIHSHPGRPILGRVIGPAGEAVPEAWVARCNVLSDYEFDGSSLTVVLTPEYVSSDASGLFEFPALPLGTRFTLEVGRAVLYRPEEWVIRERAEILTLRVAGSKTVEGVLRGADGEPLVGASVVVHRRAQPRYSYLGSFAGVFARTGPDGGFRIRGLVPGRYRLTAEVEGSETRARRTIEVTADGPEVLPVVF